MLQAGLPLLLKMSPQDLEQMLSEWAPQLPDAHFKAFVSATRKEIDRRWPKVEVNARR